MNTAAISKQLVVMKLTILTVMFPRVEGPQPVSQNILPYTREYNNLWSFIYLFVIFLIP